MVELVKERYLRYVGVEVKNEKMACHSRAPWAAASVELTIDGKKFRPGGLAYNRELGALPSSSSCGSRFDLLSQRTYVMRG